MKLELNLKSSRSNKARLAHHIGKQGYFILQVGIGIFILLALVSLLAHQSRGVYFSLAITFSFLMVAIWYKQDLANIPPVLPASRFDDILSSSLLARLRTPLTPQSMWGVVSKELPAKFLCNHLLLSQEVVGKSLSDNAADMDVVWRAAIALYSEIGAKEMDGGILTTALIMTTPALAGYLAQIKLANEDVIEVNIWLERLLDYIHKPRPYFGGFGRDWASGFTPTLDRFGENISRSVENGGSYAHYLAHGDLLDGIVNNLAHGNGVALVGETGVGKSESVRALAERLLEGADRSLQYYQIVSLNASMILSAEAGSLERLILTFFSEAVHAGNIILFLDEAQLFFGSGTGAFDLSQILMPIMQNHRLKVIVAFTPSDWQHLHTSNEALASSFAVTMFNEPQEIATMRILEDDALSLEQQNDLLISYPAIKEAYRLSGQFMQDKAFPGKALGLLGQASPYATEKVVTAETIQTTIEKTLGVRATTASAPEADVLLHLEDHIHQRMINQAKAVDVVAAALRRGRAGVSDPKRPVGSFLFLGPTGVGKTELARSLAAVYFGDEHQMIRLDMSEYQQPEDVERLLSAGKGNEKSLLIAIREQPFSVVLLDEVEKAHPNILNLLLQLLDEGQLTDQNGRPASFRSAIIIATSNAGAPDIAARVKAGDDLNDFERPLIDKLIAAGQFKPELVNRFDEIVLFRPLNESELAQVAKLMLDEVNKTLANQKIRVDLTPAALEEITKEGYDPEFGARPMRRVIQKSVEDAVAIKILDKQAAPGSSIMLDVKDLSKDTDAINTNTTANAN